MSSSVLSNLREERDQARNAALAMVEAADYDPNSDALKQLEERAESLDGQVQRLVKLMDSQSAADALDGRMSKSQQAAERDAASGETRELSWGEQFVRSSIWTEYPLRGTSAKVTVESRALPHSLTSMADALPASTITDLTPPASPDVLIPLTSVIPVSQNSIDYIVWALISGEAEVVAEKGVKPELEWAPSVESKSLETIAGRTSFTRQMAEDASSVQAFINGELQREVSRKVEREAKAALAAATLPAINGPAGSGSIGAIRAGMAAVQAAGFSPNGFLVSSDDLVTMDLAVMQTAGTGPVRTAAYWGLQPIIDPEMSAGDPVIVGDFKAAVQHYRRNSVQLYSTDSHGTHFAENILDVLAEQRCKTVVNRPAALVKATGRA